jgi:HAE1 family hydrophobic/amphiphilic exporter-1
METSFLQDETALNSILGNDEAPVVIEIQGDDLDEIERLCAEVKTKVQDIRIIQPEIVDGGRFSGS